MPTSTYGETPMRNISKAALLTTLMSFKRRYKMKTFILSILILISSHSIAAPFGTEMGMSKDELGIKSVTKEIATYKWELSSLPKSSNLFESYIVVVTPENGLCFLKAVGQNVTTSVYGTELRTAFDRVNNSLKRKYSKSYVADFLNSGSIWDEPKDFMMGLLKKERTLAAYYDEEEGSTMVEGVAKAYIKAYAMNSNKGWVTIDYFFDNHDACSAEITAIEDDVF
jgi:hypothetical protein